MTDKDIEIVRADINDKLLWVTLAAFRRHRASQWLKSGKSNMDVAGAAAEFASMSLSAQLRSGKSSGTQRGVITSHTQLIERWFQLIDPAASSTSSSGGAAAAPAPTAQKKAGKAGKTAAVVDGKHTFEGERSEINFELECLLGGMCKSGLEGFSAGQIRLVYLVVADAFDDDGKQLSKLPKDALKQTATKKRHIEMVAKLVLAAAAADDADAAVVAAAGSNAGVDSFPSDTSGADTAVLERELHADQLKVSAERGKVDNDRQKQQEARAAAAGTARTAGKAAPSNRRTAQDRLRETYTAQQRRGNTRARANAVLADEEEVRFCTSCNVYFMRARATANNHRDCDWDV
jgi:hypothetical protein